MNIAIIGAGIGGITTALFLEKQGIPVQIFEQAPEIKPVGAGIILAHNAMQVFDKLGFKESLVKLGNPLTSTNIKTADFKVINQIETQVFDAKFSVNSIAIQRGVLQTFLINKLNTKCLNLNKKVVDITMKDKTSILFSDGDVKQFDAVIGADGINSVIRGKLFTKTTLRNPNQTCWRGISEVNLPTALDNELNELWGKGSRFGFVKLAPNKVYWYGLHNSDQHLEKHNLKDYFNNYDPIVNEIIEKTDLSKVFKSDIYDFRPISTWFNGSVCLLGDAAHATTPNMGQGACQAIEDAYVIGHYLTQYPTNVAFSKYEMARKTKAEMVVNLSWRLGAISQLKNVTLSSIRNFVMRIMPSNLTLRQSEAIYTLPKL